jgi:hypothetical protein
MNIIIINTDGPTKIKKSFLLIVLKIGVPSGTPIVNYIKPCSLALVI